MTTYYVKQGNTFRITNRQNLDLHESLPVGNYIVGFDQMTGQFFLEVVEGFSRPPKLYGNTTNYADRIIHTFLDRPMTTGVMLSGEKGSGKTLLAKEISMRLAEAHGISTIIINKPLTGDGFNKFIQSINQPAVILFDEFEKIYSQEHQAAVLTLLDGVFPTKKLFLLTCNDKWRIDSHMRNRPGRIYYNIDFNGLDHKFIREYCEDRLNNKKFIEAIVNYSSAYVSFNFDMLQAIVEEMNRYDEHPRDAIKILNARPEYNSRIVYDVNISVNNKKIEAGFLHHKHVEINPLGQEFNVSCYTTVDEDGEADGYTTFTFSPSDIVRMDPETQEIFYQGNADGDKVDLILSRHKSKAGAFDAWGRDF